MSTLNQLSTKERVFWLEQHQEALKYQLKIDNDNAYNRYRVLKNDLRLTRVLLTASIILSGTCLTALAYMFLS